MQSTKLQLQDKLPLTCSRRGTCCHGNLVMLSPWELACLARAKKMTPREFRDLYCDYKGIRLRFDGKTNEQGKKACSQYIDNFGCSVHTARPLACRLFPLGRQIQNDALSYMFQGDQFPCLEFCPEVASLTYLTVDEYLADQQTASYEMAQIEYLKLMQNLADIAFELLLDTGLAESGDKETLPQWRKMSNDLPEVLANSIDREWMDSLMIPDISFESEDPVSYALKHHDLLLLKVQEKMGNLQTFPELQHASVLMMGLAFHLARALGAKPEILAEHWINTARQHGAME